MIMAQAALKVIRPLVRVSSFLSPRLTGRLAFRLFCTPVGHARINRDSATMRKAEALFAQGEASRVTYGCGYVHTVRFAPEGEARGTVLVLHGWTGQGLFMAGFVRPLLERGLAVIVMDMPAHGGSSGNKLNFPLALQAISSVTRADLPLAGILAHSFGGAVAMAAVAGGVDQVPPIAAERIVSIAAPSTMQVYGRQFTRMLGLTQRGHQAFEERVHAIAGRRMESFSGRDFLARTGVPALVIHAGDDKEIAIADAEELATAGPHVRLMRVEGLGHRRILSSREVQNATADFLAGAG